jgi:hypothetical protein
VTVATNLFFGLILPFSLRDSAAGDDDGFDAMSVVVVVNACIIARIGRIDVRGDTE